MNANELETVSLFHRARLRRIETVRLLRLALPILGAQLAQVAMGTVDVAMTGHASARDLAAVSVGTSLWLPMVVLIIGTLMGVTPIVAQHAGARHLSAIRPTVHQALWIAVGLGSVCAVLLWFAAPPLFRWMCVPPAVAERAIAYVRAVAFGLPLIACYEALRFYSDGMGHTRASLLFALFGLTVNVLGNYVFIFGGAGFGAIFGSAVPTALAKLPALGARGCGIATAVSMSAMFVGLFVYVRRASAYRPARTGRPFSRPEPALIGELLRVGLPMGVALFAEVSLFSLIALFIAGFGKIVIAAHTVALNFSSILFMMPLALGMALTVRVGRTLGQGKHRHARFVAGNGVLCALAAAGLIDLILVFAGPYAVALYSSNTEVQQLAINLLRVATLYQFSDALQAALAGALRGYKDTRMIMTVTLPSYWVVGLGAGNVLGRGVAGAFDGLGVYGYWIGLIAGLSAAAALLGWRLARVTASTRA